MNKPLTVSIVIPAYNEGRYLGACLRAIAAQTVVPDEVIIVDNNSTDDTGKIAQSYPFVRVVHEPRQGVMFARDVGFDAATGDIIGRIDADTVLPPNWVEHIQHFFGQPSHLQCAWTGGAFYHNLRLAGIVAWAQDVLVFRLNRVLLGHHMTWGSNMALPRELWQKVRGQVSHRSDVHEDIDLSICLHRADYCIVYEKSFRVMAELRRVRSSRDQLWQNLQWWPRTLRYRNLKSWVVAWIVGVWLFYALSFLPPALEATARVFGRPALRS